MTRIANVATPAFFQGGVCEAHASVGDASLGRRRRCGYPSLAGGAHISSLWWKAVGGDCWLVSAGVLQD